MHRGQFIIVILLTPFRRTDAIIGLSECEGLSRFEQAGLAAMSKREQIADAVPRYSGRGSVRVCDFH